MFLFGVKRHMLGLAVAGILDCSFCPSFENWDMHSAKLTRRLTRRQEACSHQFIAYCRI